MWVNVWLTQHSLCKRTPGKGNPGRAGLKMVEEIGIGGNSFRSYEKGLWLLALEEWENIPRD